MSDVSQTERPQARFLPGRSVDQLAARALRFVAHRPGRESRGLIAQCVTQLHRTVTEDGSAAALAAVRQMVKAGIRPEDIAERYIPAVAIRLGEQWCSDEMGFATVTIGVARLQGLLREIEEMMPPPRRDARAGASLLVLVAEGVDHTLGAMVLTGRLRRSGHAVRLILGAEPGVVRAALRETLFDAVLISAPRGTSAAMLRPLVDAARDAVPTAPPVVIGGSVLEQERDPGADILTLTGADHATCDPDEALRLCGLAGPGRNSLDRRQAD